jgi:hypothetical protein
MKLYSIYVKKQLIINDLMNKLTVITPHICAKIRTVAENTMKKTMHLSSEKKSFRKFNKIKKMKFKPTLTK